MIVSDAFKGKTYAVLGLARSGLATVATLVASGARVVAWDTREEAQALVADSCEIADPLTIDLSGFDGVVVSPGVPLNRHPIAHKAKEAGAPIIGDIELFALARPTLPPHKVVGITGTNGKSTTTALIHHIIEQAGYPARMGGNIGLPILGQDPLEPNLKGVGVYVLELSSYQIDLTFSLDCDVAVLLNITPDHLDRYDGFEGYAASKARLFDMQSGEHAAVIVGNDEASHQLYERLRAQRPWSTWSTLGSLSGGEPQDLWVGFEVDELADAQAHWPTLQGPHNKQNAIAAMLTAKALGVSNEQLENALASYASLPHRMQRIGEVNGVLYVNDSKATNAASTAPALAAYPPIDGRPRIHWILGGVAKTDHLDECIPHYANVKHAYTMGESGHMFADLLRPHMEVDDSEMLLTAVRRAARVAEPGDVVLLSPACASFDQFRDFEARGDAFVAAVAALG